MTETGDSGELGSVVGPTGVVEERGGGSERGGRRWMGGDRCGAGLRGERERRRSYVRGRDSTYLREDVEQVPDYGRHGWLRG